MLNRESECLLQVFCGDQICQVFTTIELAAKTVFQADNDQFEMKRYTVFIDGKSVPLRMTAEGLPVIKMALKDEETLINALVRMLK